jgi:hypothetical protein
VEVQKEIVALRYQVAAVAKDMAVHSMDSKDDYKANANLHHTAKIYPCDGCHKE